MAGLLGYMAQNPQAQMAQDVAAYGGLSSYQPTLRDVVGGWLMDRGLPGSTVQGLVGSRGNAGAGGMGLLDFIPGANVPFAADEYMRADPTNGDKAMAAIGILPGGKAAKPVVKEGAQAARGLLDAAAQRGDEILGLLKAGRGAEVTDAMLDMGDPVQNARLGDHLYRNYDLPMDEASRQARAREMGMSADGYHGTYRDFAAVDPETAGDNFAADDRGFFSVNDPRVANEYAMSNTVGLPADGGAVMPLRVRQDNNLIADNYYFRSEGMDPYRDDDVVGVWDNYQGLLKDEAGRVNAEGVTLVSPDMRAPNGEAQVMDVTFDPSNIRSRFARFDPRLAHLRNLSAGVTGVAGGAGLLGGLLADPQQAQAQGLAGYMTGGGI